LIVVIVLVAATLIARAMGAWRGNHLDAWPAAVRTGLAMMFLFTATAHFVPGVRETMVEMIPASIPFPRFIVAFTGVCELLGAAGLLLPSTRRVAAWTLILFLIAVFPANVRAAREGMMIGGKPATPLVPRTAMQGVFIGLLWWSGAKEGKNERSHRR
jgi:uncharacterized membrane protein